MRASKNLLHEVTAQLVQAGCIAAAEEAEELVAGAKDDICLASWVERRATGEPLAWITGSTMFCGRIVRIDPGVYVPRPQSEELARRAASRLKAWGVAVDLCTGSGAIAHHLASAQPDASVVGIDIDFRALRCAQRNGVTVARSDMATTLVSHSVDLITGVVPYVPTEELHVLPRDVLAFEPLSAVDGGARGTSLLERAIVGASRSLRSEGSLLLELGGDQLAVVQELLNEYGFHDVDAWWDEEGDVRGVAALRR